MGIVERAIELAGGQKILARACGVKQQSVNEWKLRGRIPEGRLSQVEAVTGIPRWQLRPDLYEVKTDSRGRTRFKPRDPATVAPRA